jgi:hypothetical protein
MIIEHEAGKLFKRDDIMKMNEQSDWKLKMLSGLAILAIGCLCWNGGTAGRAQSAPATQSPQLQEIVKLTQAKMSDDVITSYIKNAGASYNLSADDILYLNSQGVSQAVISVLLANKSSAPAPAPVAAPATPAPPVSAAPVPSQPAPTVAAPDSEINLGYFQAQMSPYGVWVDVPGQGLCWKPNVASEVPDWRPYFNEGRWLYTEDGWSWQSDYPWGQYAFHYGRWFRDIRLGWLWVPGYNWGPAWVSWRNADAVGYMGWAPLPPGATFVAGVGVMWNGRLAVDVDFGLGADAFVFMPYDRFWEHDYLAFRAPLWRMHDLFGVSLIANHYGFVDGHFFFGGIERGRMALLTHRDIRIDRLEIRDAHIARAREFEHSRGADHRGGADHRDIGHGGEGHDSHDSGHGGVGGRDHNDR